MTDTAKPVEDQTSTAATTPHSDNGQGAASREEAAEARNLSQGESQDPNGLVFYRGRRIEEAAHIIEIAREFHAESRYAHLPFSEEKLMRVCARAANHPNDIFAVYVLLKGETVGVLHAGIGDYYLGVGGRLVTIYSYYVSRKIRASYLGGKIAVKLLRLVSEWARSQKADELHIHATSGIAPQKADKMLRRMGFETVGGSYAARLV